METPETRQPSVPKTTAEQDIDMWSGEALRPPDAGRISASEPATVVFLAGMPDSGKTTLLACIYELFQTAPYAGYDFAGSRTLIRLEKICHRARVESNEAAADTDRTPLSDDVEFVHLRLARSATAGQNKHNLLLTDISGEAFRQVRDSDEETRRLRIAGRSDIFALFLDAGRIADRSQRHSAARDSRLILSSFIRNGVLDGSNDIQVLISRSDLISSDATSGERAFLASVLAELKRTFEPRVKSYSVYEISARPPAGYRAAVGIEPVFKSWVHAKIPARIETSGMTAKLSHGDFNEHLPWTKQ